MPRVKTDAERGWIGSWLRKQRVQRGWSPEQVIDHLPEPVRVDYYRGLEAGRKPGPELLAAFEDLYGPMPAEPVAVAPSGNNNADIVIALHALTAAVQAHEELTREIVAEMRASREATQGRTEGLAAALGELTGMIGSLQPLLAGKSQ